MCNLMNFCSVTFNTDVPILKCRLMSSLEPAVTCSAQKWGFNSRPYEGEPMVNKPSIRPYFRGGYVRGGRLTSHEYCRCIFIAISIMWTDIAVIMSIWIMMCSLFSKVVLNLLFSGRGVMVKQLCSVGGSRHETTGPGFVPMILTDMHGLSSLK